ncbi:c-type cytochrome [Phreatobacter sp. AB_2022a]|uniref:c-type cytochrome n=1 Tax=Phreatobacter sp. AB_2022a TaxID=3003134 RepID=UPI0022872A4D|nr:hypothetical protein [Phreatobacter sp. AB_2022a]MCZ0734912.1 hypothetical protein [Phreatobacter sp. AB_2022a]
MIARAAFAGLMAACTVGPSGMARAGDRALGEYLAGECVTCHRLSAPARDGIPAIAGWPDAQFVAVLKSYRLKERDNPIMQTVAARLSDEEMEALAAYFGGVAAEAAR